MGIKSLGFDLIDSKARQLRKVLELGMPEGSFSIDPAADRFLVENSLAPVVGTICDEQIQAEYAWEFPHWVSAQLAPESFSPKAIVDLGRDRIEALLRQYMSGKWPEGMSQEKRDSYLASASKRIVDLCLYLQRRFQGNADRLFHRGQYAVPEIYFILRTLPGIGPKKASMIARDFASGEGAWYEGLSTRLAREGIAEVLSIGV